ncbi:MAG: hypothetical protein R3C44_12960 [Chloroflexota bacterium]
MDYMDMLKRGWSTAWDNKYLWILGFLAALGSGSKFTYSFSSGSTDSGFAENLASNPAFLGTLAAGLAAATCIGLILGIVLWLVSLAARGGLIQSVARLELHKPVSGFGEAFKLGWKKVWSLAGLTILLFGIVFLIVIALILVFVFSGGALAALFSGGEDAMSSLAAGFGVMSLCFVGLLCLLIPLMIVLNFIYAFAFRGLVLRDLSVTDSIRHGWEVLRDNLAPIIMLVLAFLLFNIIAFIIAAAILFTLGLGVAVPMGLLANTDATFLQGLLAVLGVLTAAIISAIIFAVLTTWQSSTFTIAYLNFTGKDIDFSEA